MEARQPAPPRAGYADRPADFDEVMYILDNELRMVTPVDPLSLSERPGTVRLLHPRASSIISSPTITLCPPCGSGSRASSADAPRSRRAPACLDSQAVVRAPQSAPAPLARGMAQDPRVHAPLRLDHRGTADDEERHLALRAPRLAALVIAGAVVFAAATWWMRDRKRATLSIERLDQIMPASRDRSRVSTRSPRP